jgi:hypothetical protein
MDDAGGVSALHQKSSDGYQTEGFEPETLGLNIRID